MTTVLQKYKQQATNKQRNKHGWQRHRTTTAVNEKMLLCCGIPDKQNNRKAKSAEAYVIKVNKYNLPRFNPFQVQKNRSQAINIRKPNNEYEKTKISDKIRIL